MSINRREHSQKSVHLRNKMIVWHDATRPNRIRPSPCTSWDRGREQDQLLWGRDRDRPCCKVYICVLT